MRYFTPELIARSRSADDRVADIAATEWDSASQRYEHSLKQGRPLFPPGAKRLSRLGLHDAQLSQISLTNDHDCCELFVQLESGIRLGIGYTLTGSRCRLVKHTQPELVDEGRPMAWWLYDEVEAIEPHGAACRHSILLTGGFELQLEFTKVRLFKWPRDRVTIIPEKDSVEDLERKFQLV